MVDKGQVRRRFRRDADRLLSAEDGAKRKYWLRSPMQDLDFCAPYSAYSGRRDAALSKFTASAGTLNIPCREGDRHG